ncbi:potassium channel family protein [Lachnotalea glycerini]|uniref:Two pore domain potassium channel family protein n=1 Tax=Lachnotalea glycerini TaxID=1763509 RepID=A0A371JKH6_9FIRM|nr:potassium channel family protein [Lachnotalea glycerini]RDY33238.1 two pore domain potassium channel family protein [Lachnotalea glycerini]
MKKLKAMNEKNYYRNIKIIDKYSRKTLSEYYLDSGLCLNYEKYFNLRKEIIEIVKTGNKRFQQQEIEYVMNEYNNKKKYNNNAIIIGVKNNYAYKFVDCSFKGCTFYLLDCDVNFIFEKCTIDNCNIKYVAPKEADKSLNYLLWSQDIKGLICITLNFISSVISNLDYLYGQLDQAVVSISSTDSIVNRLNIYSKRIEFSDAYKPESIFNDCVYFGDIITMTMINNQLKFNDCRFMIYELSQIEYKELNEVLEVINKMIKMEHDDKRLDSLKILNDALYYSDSNSQTWFGIMFGYLRLPKVVIKNAIITIVLFAIIYMFIGIENNGEVKYVFGLSSEPLILLKNFFDLFIESLYFSCCTFTTVGYGDFQINSKQAIFKLIPILQMILGYLYSGVMIGAIYHRISSRRYMGSND